MPRNGSGGYTAPFNSWNPAVNGAEALPADFQAVLDDLVSAMQASLAADGQTPLMGALNANNNRIVGLSAPTADGDALRRKQITKGSDIASASTITIPLEGSLFDVTGTTGITQINDAFPGRIVLLRFLGEVTLTHSSSLVLPGNETATTQEGDVLGLINISAGIWSVISWPSRYQQLTVPVGTISAYAGASAPTGWLFCRGQNVSRTTYSRLFAVIGTTYGVGDGSTTFALPDLRGEFIRGLDAGRGVDSGRGLGTAQSDDFKSHTHLYDLANYITVGLQSGADGVSLVNAVPPVATGSTGGTETRPRNVALNYIIKF